jgi:2'-5' RNA ligase
MAALMLCVPDETARILHEIPVPGEPERHDPHITVMYLGKDIPISMISKMLPVIYEVTSKANPFSVATSHVSYFPAGDNGVPIIAKIVSPPLHRFRDDLVKAFDDNKLPYDNKFPVYKPHTTLAFDPNPKTTFDLDIPEISWGAHELVLWGSNRGTGRLVIKFPLSLPQGKAASKSSYNPLYRATVQLSAWASRDSHV